jgi:prepilin-type N-terminal cleavage/methylation domain-containing protein
MSNRRRKQIGFTLLEMLMAMVLLGIAAAGVLLPFVSAAQVQREATCRMLAAQLASDLMEQIVSTPFAEIEGQWDGYEESVGQVKNASGSLFSDPIYNDFARFVSCQSASAAGVEGLLVSIQVNYKGRETARLKFWIGP